MPVSSPAGPKAIAEHVSLLQMTSRSTLPSPDFTVALEIPAQPAAPLDLSSLPAKPGVFAIEDESGQTLALSATANLRRAVLMKLQPPASDAKPSKRIDYRALARRVLALRVGSAFEADWAWLQHARRRLPLTYRAALDRWQAWFVQCDPQAEFPQFTKVAHPKVEPHSTTVHLGPFPEKHAAGRYIEMLQDAFDLCRYYHILVQSPRGTACAYKEMGRCPAPCDGSVPLDHYRSQVRDAIAFASTPIDRWRSEEEAAMRKASDEMDFETAERHRQRLERTTIATRAEFAHVDRLERLSLVAVMPGETKKFARLFLIRGGWIEPIEDVAIETERERLGAVLAKIHRRAKPPATADLQHASDFCDAAIENIGLVCWHLFRRRESKHRGAFLRLDDALTADHLLKALQSLKKTAPAEEQEDPAIIEHDADNLARDNGKTADERG